MKVKYDRSLEEQINDGRKREKASVVFTKLLAKQRSKNKDWGELNSQTVPIPRETKPGPAYA